MLQFKKYSAKNSSYRLAIELLSSLELSTTLHQAQREKAFIEDIAKRVQKSNTVLYLLQIHTKNLGFIALSVSSIGDFPSLQIDYLFVNHSLRGKHLEILENLKTSTYLIEFAIELAKEIQALAGLRYVVLLPDNHKLQETYQNIGFLPLPKQDWLYIKLS